MALTQTETEERVLASLRAAGGVTTVGDTAAATGLPSSEVETTLSRLLRIYSSHLDVDDAGHLRYRFDPAFVRRGETAAGRWFRRARRGLLRALRWLYKGWIMVVLVGYSASFIILLAVAAIAALFADEDSGGLAGLPLYLLVRVLEALFWIRLFEGDRRFERRRRQRKKSDVPFYRRVFNFVLGPEAGDDPLAAQRRFAAFVRARGGVVTAADWVAYTGGSLEAAENALTAAALRYRAQVDLTDSGALIFRFDELALSASHGSDGEEGSGVVWERPVPRPSLTGNSWGWNLWIATLGVCNLVMGSAVGASSAPAAAIVGLGIMPVAFSLTFFAVPLVRLLRQALRSNDRRRERARRELLATVFARGAAGDPIALPAELPADGEHGPVAPRLVEQARNQLIAQLEGSEDVDGSVRFQKLSAQLASVRALRESDGPQRQFGTPVFSSQEDAQAWDEAELADFDRRLARELAGPAA